MVYIPHTDNDRRVMLDAIGVEKIDDLYEAIPEDVRFPDLELPPPISEMELMEELHAYSEANVEAKHYSYFLGAGAYNHFIPSVVDHILRRNEFCVQLPRNAAKRLSHRSVLPHHAYY